MLYIYIYIYIYISHVKQKTVSTNICLMIFCAKVTTIKHGYASAKGSAFDNCQRGFFPYQKRAPKMIPHVWIISWKEYIDETKFEIWKATITTYCIVCNDLCSCILIHQLIFNMHWNLLINIFTLTKLKN